MKKQEKNHYIKRLTSVCLMISNGPRELQVAKHVCRGFPNEEVARHLKIRAGTVKTHLRNIYRRMHVTTKIEMLLTFLEQAIHLYNERGGSYSVASIAARRIKSHTGSADIEKNPNK